MLNWQNTFEIILAKWIVLIICLDAECFICTKYFYIVDVCKIHNSKEINTNSRAYLAQDNQIEFFNGIAFFQLN